MKLPDALINYKVTALPWLIGATIAGFMVDDFSFLVASVIIIGVLLMTKQVKWLP